MSEPLVNPAPADARRFRAVDVMHCAIYCIACGASLLYALSVYVPLVQRDPENQWLGWVTALNVAHVKGLAFGREVLFTYGPLGFTWIGYHPSTFPLLIAVWSFIGAAMWIALWLGFQRLRMPRLIAVAGITSIFLLVAGEHSSLHDTRLLLLPILLLAYHFHIDSRPVSIGKTVLIVAIALAGLVKFTYLIAAIVACSALTIDELHRTRRPISLFVLCAVYLIGWKLCHQNFTDLGAYVRASIIITNNYADAMSKNTPSEFQDIAVFALPAIFLLALVVVSGSGPNRSRRIVHTMGLLIILFLVFKAGFVRHDEHEIIATSILPPAIAMYLFTSFQQLRKPTRAMGWFLSLAASIFAASYSYWTFEDQNIAKRMCGSVSHAVDEVADAARIIAGKSPSIAAKYAVARDASRSEMNLLPVDGTADWFMDSTYHLAFNNLDYLPRPALQSYAAYAPQLAEADAAMLRGDRAQQNLFYNLESIDGRLPAISDGPAMLEIISHYQLVRASNAFLQFRRAQTPRPFTLVPLETRDAKFLDSVAIPAAGSDLIWAVIKLKPTATGQLISALYKPPVLVIQLTMSDGRQALGRFIPGAGRAGFLISPFVFDNQSFAMLSDPSRVSASSRVIPASFRIGTDQATAPVRNYGNSFEVQFFRVDFLDVPTHANPRD